MESKLDRGALEEYTNKFSQVVCDGFFQQKENINGDEVRELTNIQQLNLYVLHTLLRSWKKEFEKLDSPFFNYGSKPVKKARKEFMNVLSRNILISREDFTPILKKATSDTLLLFLSPYDFFINYISHWGASRIKIKDLRDLAKYTKINAHLLDAYIERLSSEESKEIFTDDATRILNEVFEVTEALPEDVLPYVQQFSQVRALDVATIYGEDDQPLVSNSSDSVQNSENGEESEESEERKDPSPDSKMDDLQVKPTVNDQFSNPEKKILADVHVSNKIESIRSHLTINQKFMFINQLFDGNSQDFNQVVDFLDNCSSQAEAMEFINSNYLKKSNWKKDAQEVREFIDLVAKKYA